MKPGFLEKLSQFDSILGSQGDSLRSEITHRNSYLIKLTCFQRLSFIIRAEMSSREERNQGTIDGIPGPPIWAALKFSPDLLALFASTNRSKYCRADRMLFARVLPF